MWPVAEFSFNVLLHFSYCWIPLSLAERNMSNFVEKWRSFSHFLSVFRTVRLQCAFQNMRA
jgi:hypothetical protein